jgi:hypothetical protein
MARDQPILDHEELAATFGVTVCLSHVPPMLFGASRPVEPGLASKNRFQRIPCHLRNRPCWQAIPLSFIRGPNWHYHLHRSKALASTDAVT